MTKKFPALEQAVLCCFQCLIDKHENCTGYVENSSLKCECAQQDHAQRAG